MWACEYVHINEKCYQSCCYQTDLDTKRLIWLYYLSSSASQVSGNALCAIDFYFSLSSPFLPGRLSCHFSTSTSVFRALKRPAGQTDAGPDQSVKVNWDTSCTPAHADTSQIFTNTHPHPPPLHSGLPASSLIDLHLLYQMDSSLFLSSTSFLSVWLRIINVPDRVRRVRKQFFI